MSSRIGYAAVLAFACVLAAVVLSGCIQQPSNYKTYVINASTNKISFDQCTCMLCTNSSGHVYVDVFTTGLESGSCFFASNCSRAYIYAYLTDSKKNFVRDFLIGQGGSYTEYEESNLRCGLNEGYIVKALYSKGRPPFYNKKKLFGTYDTSEADTVECALSKGAIPIYIIYTKGTYYDAGWIKDFMESTVKDRTSTEPVFIAPEALFEAKNAKEIASQVNVIYDNCGVKLEKGSCAKYNPQTGDCAQYETRYVRGCKVALYPKQDTDAQMFEALDALNANYKQQMDKVTAVILTLNVDKKNFNCDAGQAIANITNRSRFVLNKYGKPSFLIFSIDKGCAADASNIALEFYSGIPFMRMTGIYGAAYSQFYEYEDNPLNNGINAYSFASSMGENAGLNPGMDDWVRLCKYYNEPPYKREPIVFQSNGVNITNACDFLTTYKMIALGGDEAELAKINSYSTSRLNIKSGKVDYEICIPEIDFGGIERIAKPWAGWDSFTVPGLAQEQESSGSEKKEESGSQSQQQQPVTYSTMCWEGYPEVEAYAERCGLSRHLVRAMKRLGVPLARCDDWYNVEEETGKSGLVRISDISPTGNYEDALGKVAFMYALKKSSPDIYTQMLDKKSSLYSAVGGNLYLICNGAKVREGSVEKTIRNEKPCQVLKAYYEYKNNCEIGRLIERIKQQAAGQQAAGGKSTGT
ncbi:MAG: hypothetical protein N3G76_01755 [Candidatus Micrarchaeota archaeon]|nr:hypothetical protein [Candidatus Micrarchaeota archaeon]